jgi:hypothetical protein
MNTVEYARQAVARVDRRTLAMAEATTAIESTQECIAGTRRLHPEIRKQPPARG